MVIKCAEVSLLNRLFLPRAPVTDEHLHGVRLLGEVEGGEEDVVEGVTKLSVIERVIKF